MLSSELAMYLASPVVVGFGQTGVSFMRCLQRLGVTPLAWLDSRAQAKLPEDIAHEFASVPMVTGPLSQHWLEQATVVLLSPGAPRRDPALLQWASHCPIWGDVELFVRLNTQPIIAITGTNGKSTVTTLVGQLLTAAGVSNVVAGNIGVPVLDSLLLPKPDYYVLELSSYQLESTYSLKAWSAVVLNVAEDHMDRYDHFSDYVRAKQRIYCGAQYAVLNMDQPEAWQGSSLPLTCQRVSLQAKADADFYLQQHAGQAWLFCQQQPSVPVAELAAQAVHEQSNALFAMALLAAVPEVNVTTCQNVLRQFTGLAHRCQWVGDYRGMAWVNDSKATNVASCVTALQSFGQQYGRCLWWIAGGEGKSADFTPLAEPASCYVKQALLIGKDREQIAAALPATVAKLRLPSLEAAVALAMQQGEPGDVVLLSPACASFDAYANFEQRGDAFVAAVQQAQAACANDSTAR